uniref:RING-type domain-containing protein n=1 Tax=Strongyloides papillosus TaxID=174720 RepID=A0A0N5BCC5_STREA
MFNYRYTFFQMPFICNICSEPFTTPGTNHAVCSTICGHLMGKSCIEKWKETRPSYRFNCPTCHTILNSNDYHPVYDLPDEVFNSTPDVPLRHRLNEEEVVRHYLFNYCTQEPAFFRNLEGNFSVSIELFDTYNEYVLVVGFTSKPDKNTQFIEMVESSSGIKCFSEELGPNVCTSLAFNKYRDDAVEFCIGFEDGFIKRGVCSVNLLKFFIVNEYSSDFGKIYSMCYIGKDQFAFSVGEGAVFVCNINNLSETKDWVRLYRSDRSTITNLQKLSDTAVLGIMNNKIYVFERDKMSYVLYSVDNKNITNYTLNSQNNMIIVFCSSEDSIEETTSESQSYILRISNKSKIEGYQNFFITNVIHTETYQFPLQFKTSFFVSSDLDQKLIYLFVPNLKSRVLEAIQLGGKRDCLSKEPFENLDECIGVYCLGRPQLFLTDILRMKVVLIFKKKFYALNFYYPIND